MEPELRRPLFAPIFAGVCLVCLLVVLVVGIILSLQARTALCAYKASAEESVASSQAFLRMTPEQRQAKYGSIGDIPDDVIRRGLARQRRTVQSLSALHC